MWFSDRDSDGRGVVVDAGIRRLTYQVLVLVASLRRKEASGYRYRPVSPIRQVSVEINVILKIFNIFRN
jgi:hypothetical protein